MCCLLFNRVFCFHIQLASHLVAVVSKKIIVKRLVISCNGTANRSSMSCKDCCNLWNRFLQVESTQTRHPLMSLINYFIIFSQVKTVKTFYNFTCCIREHRSFIVIAVCMQRIYLEIFPHLAINRIFLSKERKEINQDHHRFSRNIPTADTNFQSVLFQRMFTPCDTQIFILNK